MRILPMPYRVDGAEKLYNMEDEPTLSRFYQDLRSGKMATTAQVTVDDAFTCFEELTNQGHQVLYLGLSSGLSGTVQSAQTAKDMVLEKNPKAKITVVDSLLASAGEALFIHYALKMRDEGKSMEETAKWLVNNRQRFLSWFTVDDRFPLPRRPCHRTSALLGGMMRIKPIMHVNHEGKLIPRRKPPAASALRMLADKVIELSNPKEGQTVFISHGDCREDADHPAGLIKEA